MVRQRVDVVENRLHPVRSAYERSTAVGALLYKHGPMVVFPARHRTGEDGKRALRDDLSLGGASLQHLSHLRGAHRRVAAQYRAASRWRRVYLACCSNGGTG